MDEPSREGALLESLGLEQTAVRRLSTYLEQLARWSPRINLTGLATAEERVRGLIASVLPAVPLALPGRLIDVGSGNGSPGLVFAAVRDDLEIALLEPRLKRWAFLRETVRVMARPGVSARRERHDQYTGPPGHTVTLRALRLTLQDLAPLVADGGRVLVFGGRPGPAAGFVEEPAAPHHACHVFRRCFT